MSRTTRIEPGPGQQSVWDFPRPPRVESETRRLRVEFAGRVIADTTRGLRVLETSQAPAYYFPAADVDASVLRRSADASFCEWKGQASYVDLVIGAQVSPAAAWRYLTPTPSFAAIAGCFAFYPQRVDACFIGDERIEPNGGDFYGGWVSSLVSGPFKGGPGTSGW